MPITPPASKTRTFIESTAPWDIALALFASWAVWARATAARTTLERAGWAVFAIAIVAAGIGKVVVGYRERAKKTDPHDLEGCLHTLETILLGEDVDPAKRAAAGLRLAVHIPDKADLVQVCDYIGDQRTPSAKGRRFPQASGVAGQAFRESSLPGAKPALHCGARLTENYDAFVAQMVTDYGFTEQAAKALNPATMSWLAYPIMADLTLYGVLYCDSKQSDFFDDDRRRDVVNAMAGVAYFVGRRYA